MDLNKYRLFADVAITKSFTRTAERTGYSQPGVSKMLKSLEDDLGITLFRRTKNGVFLTPNAEEILPTVRKLLNDNGILEQKVAAMNSLNSGHMTIACFASTSRIIFPEIIHSYEEKYPGIGITLLEGGTDEIVNWVNDEAADFGILSRRNIDTLHFIPLMRDPLVAILPKEEPYTSMKEFDIKEFEQQPFIISAEGTDYDIHHMIQKTGIKPDTRLTSRDDHAIVSMVAAHLGISILPMLVVKDLLYMVHAIPLKPYFDREIGICYLDKGAVSPAAKNFMYLIREKFAENNASNS